MRTVAIISSQAFSLVNFRGRLIADLVAQGDRVYALAPDYSAELRDHVCALGAIPVDFALVRTGLSPWRDLRDMARLTLLLRQLQPDVTLSYFVKPVIYGTLAAWMARVPHRVAMIEGLGYVFTATGSKLSWPRVLLREGVKLLYRMALSRAHRVIFLNKDDIFDFLKLGLVSLPKVVHMEGIGVDLDYWQAAAPVLSPVTFLLAARLLREKGILEFAQAATLVRQRQPKTRFILLGALDLNPGCLDAAQVRQLVEDGIVEWPGHVNLKPWMAQASVYVLPSYREGLPRSTQEAMAMGRAVITTDVPGCRETVVEGINGFLVPVRDEIALADAMLKFVEHPQYIEAMGLQSRHMAQARFDVRKINPQLLNVLNAESALSDALPSGFVPEPYTRQQASAALKPVHTVPSLISVSIVSHEQIDLVVLLLQDITLYCQHDKLEIILTLNVDELLPFDPDGFSFSVCVIRNQKPKGFSANHNHALRAARGDYFCVVNPDIRFDSSPFSVLISCFENPCVGVVAPLVFGSSGEIEDSIRTFPTPRKILRKAFSKTRQRDYFPALDLIQPDWIGGMFMLFRRSVFEMLEGFDESYYLYYEDVDICARLRLASFQTVLCPTSPIVHHAQRSSHSNIKYLRWHIVSMLRFFTSSVYRQLRRLGWL